MDANKLKSGGKINRCSEKNEYWLIFKENVVANKLIFWSALVVTVLSFGFVITNFSVGIDDQMRNYYLYSDGEGSLIQQGRLLHVVLNALTDFVDLIPFFNSFVGALLFFISALLFAALFLYVTKGRISDFSVVVFCCIYLSCSITADKFIYELDVIAVMFSYCFTALSLMYSYRFVEENSKKSFIKATLCMIVAAGSYETFLFLYVCGVFAVFILKMLYCDERLTFKSFMLKGVKYACVLLSAAIIYYGIVLIVQVLSGQYGTWRRTNHSWDESKSIVENMIFISKEIISGFLWFDYLPVIELTTMTILGGVFSIYKSIVKKNALIIVSFVALFAGNILIYFFTGYVLFRAAQTLCFYLAFLICLFVQELSCVKKLKRIVFACVLLLVLLQCADINRWFYKDYERNQKESFAVNTIATELEAQCDVSKPVVFVGKSENEYFNSNSAQQVSGKSMINWGTDAFESTMYDIFDAFGYEFLIMPDEETQALAESVSEDLPSWPVEGYIKEYDTFIVVKMGEVVTQSK